LAEELTFVNSSEIASRVTYIGRSATSPKDTPRRDEARERVRDLLGTLEGARAMKLPHRDATPEALRLVRRPVFAAWFVRIAFKPLEQLALISSSLFEPVGPMAERSLALR
jgi:hypothetical protein